MSHFKAKKAPNSISAWASPQILLGELAALQLTPSSLSALQASKQLASPKFAYAVGSLSRFEDKFISTDGVAGYRW